MAVVVVSIARCDRHEKSLSGQVHANTTVTTSRLVRLQASHSPLVELRQRSTNPQVSHSIAGSILCNFRIERSLAGHDTILYSRYIVDYNTNPGQKWQALRNIGKKTPPVPRFHGAQDYII